MSPLAPGCGSLRSALLLPLTVLLLHAGVSRGLYFHIGETEKRCFIEEIPDETMVIGESRRCDGGLGGEQVASFCCHDNHAKAVAVF